MKLLTILPGFAMGGAENMVYELCKQLGEKDVDSYILCYCGKQNTALEKKAENIAKVVYLNCTGSISMKSIKCVFEAIDRINPDIVHAHMGGALFAALWTMLKKKPLVVTIHTIPQKAFSSKIEKILKIRMLFGRFQLVAVSSENKKLADCYYRMKHECLYVNNGVDLERFYSKPHKNFTLINVARQDDNKNQQLLVDAFAKLRKQDFNIYLFLIGDGPNHENLKKKCVKLGVDNAVCLPGNVPDAEKYYAIADVYVQTSHREAMPLSILEAMAAGLPIISTDVGGVRDVVNQNGILIADNDIQGLLNAITAIIELDDNERVVYSKKSIELVQDYSSKKMANEYYKIYKGLL